MSKARFKVYSRRVDEFTKQLCYGLSRIPVGKDEEDDFGKGRVWGEIQMNCDQDAAAAEEFEQGDIIEVSFTNLGKAEEPAGQLGVKTPEPTGDQLPVETEGGDDPNKPKRKPIVDEDDDDEDEIKPKGGKATTSKA